MTTPATRLPVANGAQLTLRLTQSGQTAAVVLGARYNLAGNVNTANATAWANAFWNAFRGQVSSAVTVTGATMRDVSVANGNVVEAGVITTPAGAGTGPSALAAGSLLVRWKTATGGRSGKGRTFIPGLQSGQLSTDGRTLASSIVTALDTACTTYIDSFTTGAHAELDPAVLSFTKGAAYVITSGSASTIAGVQRRRMRA